MIDTKSTGETILDEALKMMKAQEGERGEGERMSIANWIDLLSGTSVLLAIFSALLPRLPTTFPTLTIPLRSARILRPILLYPSYLVSSHSTS